VGFLCPSREHLVQGLFPDASFEEGKMGVSRVAVMLLASAAGLSAPALAAGGGGGSGPSVSAPSYDPAAEYRNGIEALKAGRHAEAKKAFERVMKVAPGDPGVYFVAGLACNGLGDLKCARRYFERAVRLDKQMIDAHRELGIVYAKSSEWAKARAELDRLKAMQQACGAGCAKAAQLNGAVEVLAAAFVNSPKARLDAQPSLIFASAEAGDRAYLEAVSLINERRYEEAIASLQAARASFGAHPDILTYLGFANRKLGRFDAAEAYYRAALAAVPQHRGAREYYGELMVERGDLKGAKRMLASLDSSCTFGCAEADELRRWIEAGAVPTH
jgi:Flp pilus assembly protein TadD